MKFTQRVLFTRTEELELKQVENSEKISAALGVGGMPHRMVINGVQHAFRLVHCPTNFPDIGRVDFICLCKFDYNKVDTSLISDFAYNWFLRGAANSDFIEQVPVVNGIIRGDKCYELKSLEDRVRWRVLPIAEKAEQVDWENEVLNFDIVGAYQSFKGVLKECVDSKWHLDQKTIDERDEMDACICAKITLEQASVLYTSLMQAVMDTKVKHGKQRVDNWLGVWVKVVTILPMLMERMELLMADKSYMK